MTRGSFSPSNTIRPENYSETEKSPKGESVSSSLKFYGDKKWKFVDN